MELDTRDWANQGEVSSTTFLVRSLTWSTPVAGEDPTMDVAELARVLETIGIPPQSLALGGHADCSWFAEQERPRAVEADGGR